jgi:DNA-binding NarL/FixJ family response regulator
MEPQSRLLIADDQRLFADNLRSVLEYRAPDFQVVGIASHGQEALDLVRQTQPDLVLMDIRMPILDGVQATGLIHAEFPNVKILVLTTFDDDQYVHEAIRNGAIGYLLKNIPFDDLLSALRTVRSGAALFSPAILAKLVPLRSDPAPAREAPEWYAALSRREKEILRLMARGLDNVSIAEALYLSEQTIKNYVYGLYGKIGEHNRVRVVQILRSVPELEGERPL